MRHYILLPLALLTAMTASAHRIDTETVYRHPVGISKDSARVMIRKTAKRSEILQRIEGDRCKVRLTFPADPDQWMASGAIDIYNNDVYIWGEYSPYDENGNYLPEKNWAEVELAPGIYDFKWEFTHLNNDWSTYTDYDAIVVHEQVNISGDCELKFDPATATQVINFAPLMPDGAPFKPLKCKWNWNEDWSWTEQTITEEGNIYAWSLARIMCVPDYDMLTYASLGMGAEEVIESPAGIFNPFGVLSYHITPVSNRYQLGFKAIIAGDHEAGDITYALTASQTGSESGTISNDITKYTDPTDFKTMHTPAGRNTPELFPDFQAENPYDFPYSLSNVIVSNGVVSTGVSWTVSFLDRNEKTLNVRASMDKDNILSLLLAPQRLELSKNEDVIETAKNIGGWTNCNGDFRLAFNGDSYLWEVVNPGAPEPSADGFAPLSGTLSQCEDINFGTSPSILNIVSKMSVYDENRAVPSLMINAQGRLGDVRESDNGLGSYKLTVDGETVAENYEEIQIYFDGYTERKSGLVDYSWSDTNFETEGLPGGCDFNMTFDLGKADYCPPTLTALQIRRKSTGTITSVVNDLDDAEVRITAGDFNCVMIEPNQDKTLFEVSAPASIRLEAAPTGTNDFTNIELTEEPSMFNPTGIGAYYHGSLAAAGDADGWYDLKVSLTDGSGNTMTQTVRLAFKRGERSSIATITGNSWSMVVENGILRISGASKDVLTSVYGVDGQLKLQNRGTETRLDVLAPGVYILKSETNNASRIMKIRL